MVIVAQVETDAHRQATQELFWEYLTWANDMNDQAFGIRLDIQTMLDEDMANLQKFLPPHGRLLLATVDQEPSGCICLKQLLEHIAEVKRLYVRPAYRGKGVGKALVTALIDQARQLGYRAIRLDSASYMTDAQRLYRSVGFQEIGAYAESEIPAQFHQHWVFMEMLLQ